MRIKASNANAAAWRTVSAKSNIPAELEKLNELAHNMWWAWNHDARRNWVKLLLRACDNALSFWWQS